MLLNDVVMSLSDSAKLRLYVEYTTTLLKLTGYLSEKYDLTFVQVQTPTLFSVLLAVQF